MLSSDLGLATIPGGESFISCCSSFSRRLWAAFDIFAEEGVCVCVWIIVCIYILYIYNGVFLVINLRVALATSSRIIVRSRGLYPFALDRKSYHRYCQFMVLTTSLFLPVIIIVCVCVCSRTSRNGWRNRTLKGGENSIDICALPLTTPFCRIREEGPSGGLGEGPHKHRGHKKKQPSRSGIITCVVDY